MECSIHNCNTDLLPPTLFNTAHKMSSISGTLAKVVPKKLYVESHSFLFLETFTRQPQLASCEDPCLRFQRGLGLAVHHQIWLRDRCSASTLWAHHMEGSYCPVLNFLKVITIPAKASKGPAHLTHVNNLTSLTIRQLENLTHKMPLNHKKLRV